MVSAVPLSTRTNKSRRKNLLCIDLRSSPVFYVIFVSDRTLISSMCV